MSTVRQKVVQVNKEAWKAEEEKLQNANKQVIDENANIDIDKIAKVKKTKAKPKAKKTKSKKS